MTRRLSAAAAILGAATLAACSGDPQPSAPAANDTDNMVEVIDETPAENLIEAEPAPTPTPTATPVADPRPSDAQVQDDADAVGMTARVQRKDDEGAEPAE